MSTNVHNRKLLVVHWFRQGDLRLHDNPSLKESVKAATASKVKNVVGQGRNDNALTGNAWLPVMCMDPRIYGGDVITQFETLKTGPRRAKFLLESVQDLRHNLKREMNSDLLVAFDTPENVFKSLANASVGRFDAIEVFCQDEPCSEEKNTVKEVGAVLKTHHSSNRVIPVWGSTLYHLKDLPFPGEAMGMPDVFTPFRNKIEKNSSIGQPLPIPLLQVKDQTTLNELNLVVDQISVQGKCSTTFLPSLKEMGYSVEQEKEAYYPDKRGVMEFKGGETAGLERIKEYIWTKNLLKDYFDTRNGMLGADYSTKLAPWLAHGCVSPRHVAAQCKQYEQARVANKSTYWVVFELLWRDFFKFFALKNGDSIFFLDGTLGKDRSAGRHENSRKWSWDPRLFKAWKTGNTGYPLVDANMRELAETGFMSNRGRQNVASFLAIDMSTDWRYGAAYFEEQLLDYDVHSNWGNWCSAAGMTGGRLNRFNIVKQSKDYDYDGDYLRHWLPELKDLPSPLIHEPWKMSEEDKLRYNIRLGVDYPNPIIPPYIPRRDDPTSNSRETPNKKNYTYSKKRDEKPAHWKKGGRKNMKSLPAGQIRLE